MDDGQYDHERQRRGREAEETGQWCGREALLACVIQELVERATPQERTNAIRRLEARIATTCELMLQDSVSEGYEDVMAAGAAGEVNAMLDLALGRDHADWTPAALLPSAEGDELLTGEG